MGGARGRRQRSQERRADENTRGAKDRQHAWHAHALEVVSGQIRKRIGARGPCGDANQNDERTFRQNAQQQPQYAQQPPPQYAQQPQYAQPPQYAEQPQYAQAPTAPSTDDMLEQLQKLGELKTAGVLTEDEFQAQKAKILAR